MVTQDEKLIKLISGRQQKLESDKENWIQRMQDIADYVIPHRDDIRGTLYTGLKKGAKIYDGTAQSAAVLATNGIHGYHVSPAFPWFQHKMSMPELNKIKEIRQWLQDIDEGMYNALTRSNFYSEIWQYIYDGYTLATASMTCEEDISEGRIVFEAVHPGEGYIQENKYGEVDLYHRKRKLTTRKLVQMFGLENLPENIKQNAESQPFHEHEIIHATYPREDYDTRKRNAENKKFASVWMIKAGSHICRISGFDKFPYSVWRYMKTGKDVYGVGPAHLVMSDIKSVNLMAKTIQGAAQMAVDPPWNIPGHLLGKVQLKPRGFNYMQNDNQRITPINSGVQYPIGIDREQAKQKAIRERFHVDTFLLLSQLNSQPGQRTKYEVSELLAERAAVLGAELGPLNTQLDNILDKVYIIEQNAGRIPQPPDIVLEYAELYPGLRFDPEYQGPLAQAQKEKFGKQSIQKLFVDIAPLVQLNETVVDNFDLDQTAILIADINNVPEEIKRAPDKVMAIREGRAQAQAEMQQQEDMANAMQGVKTISEADRNMGGSISKAVEGGLGA